ncbi:hypothetical protein ABAC460_23835, partial [Asticcacaulis sp. AC460]
MGVRARRHKVEIMKQGKCTTDVAGVDIGKKWLDVALAKSTDHCRIANNPAGFTELTGWLRAHKVKRVGMEASGDYERGVRTALEAEDFEVVLHQPMEVKAFAIYRRIRMKSDKADARLIALATQAYDGIIARRDPYLVDLADLLTYYEQTSDLLAMTKNMAEHERPAVVKAMALAREQCLVQQKRDVLKLIIAKIRARPDLNVRFDLLKTLSGVGDVVAAVLVVRMPELGSLEHGQAASLLGVAPFDRDSGNFHGRRFIIDGRSRPRTFVYMAALVAKRIKSDFKTFADRLLGTGKPPKVVIVAVMRKLIEAANLVLK